MCERSSILTTFGGDRIYRLSSRLLPAAKGSYRAAGRRHCSRPGSRSAPRTVSRASPSVLEIKKCCSSWSISFVTPKSCWRFVTAIGIFLFSAVFITVSVLRAPYQRSPLPDTTKFSNLGRSSSRIDQASRSSAPPTEYETSSRLGHEDSLILDASPGVLQKLAVTVPAVHGCRPQQSPDAGALVPPT